VPISEEYPKILKIWLTTNFAELSEKDIKRRSKKVDYFEWEDFSGSSINHLKICVIYRNNPPKLSWATKSSQWDIDFKLLNSN